MITRQPAHTAWRKSSRSTGNGNSNCVEVRAASSGFEIRDSKLGSSSPILAVCAASFEALLTHAATSPVRKPQAGRFNSAEASWNLAFPTGALEIGYGANGMVALRLSGKGDTLVYTASEWNAFAEGARLGEFEPEVLAAELIPA